jgi:membrane-bound serine protease (ClpP class)
MVKLPFITVIALGAVLNAKPQGPGKPKVVAASQPASAPAAPLPEQETTGPLCVIDLNASINPGTGAYIVDSINTAKDMACGVLVMTLDTPGGMLQTTREIVKAILSAPLPVVVYVSPPGSVAGSAGVFITLAGHIAVMAPGTNIGAAHPVSSGGKDIEAEGGKEMARKIENDTIAFVESIAIERNRNKEWAIKAVKESVSIPATVALEQKVIDFIATDLSDLQKQLDGRRVNMRDKTLVLRTLTKEVRRIQMSISQRVTSTLAEPQIVYVLMTIGMIGLMMELYHPGSIFPGVAGAICLLLAFVSMQVLPISWGGVALIALGFGLLIAELFVTSHGILGVGGGIAVTLGGLLLINTQDPDYYVEPTFALGWMQVLPLGIVMAGMAVFLATVVLRGKLARPEAGQEALVGVQAVVREPIHVGADGLVMLSGELWRASADEVIGIGATVIVERVSGLRVFVRKV